MSIYRAGRAGSGRCHRGDHPDHHGRLGPRAQAASVAGQASAAPLAFANGGIGLTGRLPRDWTAVRGSGFVQLVSKRRDATIEIVARPVFAGTKPPLLKPAVDAIRKSYNSVSVRPALGSTLGGVPARSLVLYARNKRGVPIRVLVAAAEGRRRAWVLEAFTAQKASQQALVEAQQIVLSLHLTG